LNGNAPVVIVGAGPVGLTAALGLAHHGVPFLLLEEDDELSRGAKAGTVLTRTIEVWHRFGVAGSVLPAALRLDEIGEVERASGVRRPSVRLDALAEDTRFPFAVNIPQQNVEALLAEAVEKRAPGCLRLAHRVTGFDVADRVTVEVSTPDGPRTIEARYVLGCDGGRSAIRSILRMPVTGTTQEERYAAVDLAIGLPGDYPYLSYFSDPREWVVLVRLPGFWRFVFPLAGGETPATPELVARALRFVADVTGTGVADPVVVGSMVYSVHHRVAERWSHQRRVFLLGDAAHLITPMWALGMNTGVLDASNIVWRLAWVLRGWADESLLDGYEREQRPLAVEGTAQMAAAARRLMTHQDSGPKLPTSAWALAGTRALLGVRLDVDGTGNWSLLADESMANRLPPGARLPDLALSSPDGPLRLHDLVRDSFVALHFTDARQPYPLPAGRPGLAHFAVSRWDAQPGSPLRDRLLLDPGGRAAARLGVPLGTVVLIRPDGHVSGICAGPPAAADQMYHTAVAF
jgi:3-(3-hydroxy-phenyl)propionate hydroxylase